MRPQWRPDTQGQLLTIDANPREIINIIQGDMGHNHNNPGDRGHHHDNVAGFHLRGAGHKWTDVSTNEESPRLDARKVKLLFRPEEA